ncbi:MAG: hypothetical protein KAW41_06695 [Candidatus Diapherotrites archaeon]|nr:hypothetical protein [Candidatus Diapherotrites archaeon]
MKRVLALLLIISTCLAAQVIDHEIRIGLHEDGSAYVEQEYFLRLDSGEGKEFEALVKDGASFPDLGAYGISKVITYETTDENVVMELTQSDFGVVVLQYTVPEVVEAVEKVGKQELTGITENAFTFFDGSTISLPYDPPTTLKIGMPITLRLAREVTPPAYSTAPGLDASGQKVTYYEWNYKKPFTSGKFRVLYEKEIPLQSQLSLRSITSEIREKYGNPVYMIAGLILLAMVVWYRKEIGILLSESFMGEPVLEEEFSE